jgi:hypothetical protein
MSFIATLGGSENCFIIPHQTPSHSLSHSLLAPLPPSVALNLSRGTGCPVKQHRWRNAEPPRDLKHRLTTHNSHTRQGTTRHGRRVSVREASSFNEVRLVFQFVIALSSQTTQPRRACAFSSSPGGGAPSVHPHTHTHLLHHQSHIIRNIRQCD